MIYILIQDEYPPQLLNVCPISVGDEVSTDFELEEFHTEIEARRWLKANYPKDYLCLDTRGYKAA